LGTDGHSRDDGDFVPAVTMPMYGSLAAGAQVLTTWGINKNPDSSAKTMWAPIRAAFFYAGPILPFPALHGRFVAFDRALLRLWMTPVQTVHPAPDVIPMVVHRKLAPDQFRDTRGGPHVGVVAVRQWSFPQQSQQTTPLCGRKLQRTSGRGADLQGVGTVSLPSIRPTHSRNWPRIGFGGQPR